MVGQDAVLQLRRKHRREAGDLAGLFSHHFRAHDDVAQELSVVGVVVFREAGELLRFSDVMAERRGDQQIPFQDGIGPAEIFAQLRYAQGVLQKAAHKAVVDGLGGGGHAEGADEFLVLHEEAFQQFFQKAVFRAADEAEKLLVHAVDAFAADGEVVGGVVFALTADADAFYIDLERALEADHVAVHLYVIHGVKFGDARVVGIPDLGVDGSGLILQDHIFIGFSVLGHGGLLVLAQINVKHPVAFFIVSDIFHRPSPFRKRGCGRDPEPRVPLHFFYSSVFKSTSTVISWYSSCTWRMTVSVSSVSGSSPMRVFR